jgi:hypothetical protein
MSWSSECHIRIREVQGEAKVEPVSSLDKSPRRKFDVFMVEKLPSLPLLRNL